MLRFFTNESANSALENCAPISPNRAPISPNRAPSASDARNSKLGESTGLKCSTGLLMHDFVDFDK